MKHRTNGLQGATFGVMEGIIMVLGVMVGLSASADKSLVLIGMLVAGVADAFANAAAFHVSEETEPYHTQKEIRKSTIYCFLGTFAAVVILSLPFFFLRLLPAAIISGILGLICLVLVGIAVSKINKKYKTLHLVVEYVITGIVVAVVSYIIGLLIQNASWLVN